jgi:hypothetical protein
MRNVIDLNFKQWVEHQKDVQPICIRKKKKMSNGDRKVATTNMLQNFKNPDYQNFIPDRPIYKT